jgi:hypothetical protein
VQAVHLASRSASRGADRTRLLYTFNMRL